MVVWKEKTEGRHYPFHDTWYGTDQQTGGYAKIRLFPGARLLQLTVKEESGVSVFEDTFDCKSKNDLEFQLEKVKKQAEEILDQFFVAPTFFRKMQVW